MTILHAVYKSCDRYTTPDNRYGYGIPNMQKAYNILKNLQNKSLYGDAWLIAGNTIFTNEISFKLIGKTDGKVTVNLLDANKKVVAEMIFETETGEVYDKAFTDLSNMAPGEYSLQYNDGVNANEIKLTKQAAPISKVQDQKVISAEY
jgi:hypothetical protein